MSPDFNVNMVSPISVTYANLPCKFDLILSITNIPRASLYCLTEILRPPDVLRTHLNTINANLICFTQNSQGLTTSAIAVDKNSSDLVENSQVHPMGACCVSGVFGKIVCVYVSHQLTDNQQRNMAEWTARRAKHNSCANIIIGDMNTNSRPTFIGTLEHRISSKGMKEYVHQRPTFFRGPCSTSIDRCFSSSALQKFRLSRSPEVSDHALILFEVPTRRGWRTKFIGPRYWSMKHPSPTFSTTQLNTVEELTHAIVSDPGRRERRHCRQLDRINKQLRHAHELRMSAQNRETKSLANAEIRRLRHKLVESSHIVAMRRGMRPPQSRFEPPTAVTSEKWMEHVQAKFCQDVRIGAGKTCEVVPITPEHVSDAIKNIRKASISAPVS